MSDTDLQLYHNNNIQSPTGSSFPSAIGGDDLVINGSYTNDSKGIVLPGTGTSIQSSGDTTFQTVSLWFRFNDIIPSFNLFDSSGDASASFTTLTTVTKARSVVGPVVRHSSTGISQQAYKYDNIRDLYLMAIGFNVRENVLGPFFGIHSGINRAVSFADVQDFDYRHSVNQYGGVDVNGDLTTSIDGTRVMHTAIWSGTAKCIGVRQIDDKFLIMIEGDSDQVCMLDGDSGVLTSIYSNTDITIQPRVMAMDECEENIIYFIASDNHIYSLDISSNSNVPVQLGTITVSTQKTIYYYKEKLYVQISGHLTEIHVPTLQVFSMGNITSQTGTYALEFENGFVSQNATNGHTKFRHPYDFNGSDGRSYTLTEGTNKISNTYINGDAVSSLEDMITYSYGGLHNVVFTLSSPSTSTLTLFGNSSGSNSLNVTVEMIYAYSRELTESEIVFSYNRYRSDNTIPDPIPRVFAKDVADFSVSVDALIDIGDIADFQALTSANYTGTFNPLNTYSLNADLDFAGETKSTINNFMGTFSGNLYRIMNHDDVRVFATITTGASLDGIVFYNFNSPSSNGVINNMTVLHQLVSNRDVRKQRCLVIRKLQDSWSRGWWDCGARL